MQQKHLSHVLTREAAAEHLGPLVPPLLDSFWEAWEWKRRLYAGDPLADVILDGSTTASVLSNAFAFYARPRLITDFGARWRSRGRFHQAIVARRIGLRFKKLDLDKVSCNIPTLDQDNVYFQRDRDMLPGMSPILLTSITMGYTLDKLGRNVSGIYFACPYGYKRNLWIWPLYDIDEGQLPLFGGEPPAPTSDIADVLNVKVRVGRRKALNG